MHNLQGLSPLTPDALSNPTLPLESEPSPSKPYRGVSRALPPWAVVASIMLPASLLLLSISMGKHLDHDEHQFVAPGALFARDGLLPYRDYPYFHTPNLLFLYAAADHLTSHLLLAARLIAAAAASAVLTILSLVVFKLFECFGRKPQWIAAIAAVAVLLFNPVFYATSGRAWNHDVPTLICLLSVLALWRGLERENDAWIALAGFGLGLAVGTRLTFAPVWLAFAVTLARARQHKLRRITLLSVGAAIAFLPSIWLFCLAPEQFIFGNFSYPLLNTEIRRISGFPRAMSLLGKGKYIFTDLLVQPGNLLLLATAIASLIGLRRDASSIPHPHRFKVVSLTWVIATLLVGSFAPTPLFPQYFFEPLPFAILLVALVAADTRKTALQARPWLRVLCVCTLIAIAPGLGSLRYLAGLGQPSKWTPMQVHRLGNTVAQFAGQGNRVLTFAPILPLEGGCKTYPEFATGPFAMRVADLVHDDVESSLKEIDADDLPELLAARPATGILVGTERGLDRILLEVAHQQHFHAAILENYPTALDPVRLWIAAPAAAEPLSTTRR